MSASTGHLTLMLCLNSAYNLVGVGPIDPNWMQ